MSDKRLDFPREWPYYLGWNNQASNAPGTTLFFPVVDCTWQYINAILILLTEPGGMRPMFIDDWRSFQPEGLRRVVREDRRRDRHQPQDPVPPDRRAQAGAQRLR